MSLPAFLHPFARPAATSFLRIVRGSGPYVWDDDDRRYLDAMASLWYCNVGHGRTEVIDAVTAQMRQIEAYHCFERFTNAPADELADRLAERAPFPGARVFFTSGGSEAVDTAVKLVRLAQSLRGCPERTVVVSRTPSYHGVTYGGMSLTGLPLNSEHFGPGIGDVVQTPKDDVEAVRAAFGAHPGRVAAVIAEPVVGAGGVHPPAPGYLAALRALCDEHGAYLISDEVICAFGRLGGTFSAERYGVRPDVVTFAKAVTSGYVPLGGVLLAPSVHEPLAADPALLLRHGYTYSGHPTACAAGLACLELTEREGLAARAVTLGERLSAGLRAVGAGGRLADVRGDGFVWAVSVPEGTDNTAVRDRMLAEGVIVRPIPPSTLAMCPPLVCKDADVDAIVAALDAALG
jgi:putrescine aminotransferase